MPPGSLRWSRAVMMVLLCLTGCGLRVTEPEVAVGIRLTSRTAVRDSLGFAGIDFQVTNAGTVPVYLPRCGSTVSADVEQLPPGASWTPVFQGTLGCYSSLYLGPYRLEPGRSVWGYQRARVNSGLFRLRVPVSSDSLQRTSLTVSSESIVVS